MEARAWDILLAGVRDIWCAWHELSQIGSPVSHLVNTLSDKDLVSPSARVHPHNSLPILEVPFHLHLETTRTRAG